jgi:Ca2+-binding RTX toxin-like protein
MPDGTIRFGGPEHTVWNGTAGGDRLWSSEGDDTIRGNDGADWMQGGDGVDNLIGGLGDDHLEDLFGDDVLKGGDGDDFISSGQGFGGDLNQGGRGKDFIVDGNDITEAFGGPGGDFVLGGDDSDTVFGDDGDDWMEGGKGPFNLLQGDNGAPFQNDPNQPGHDVIDGDGGEQDFDAEGGDDIMLMGPGIQRAEGMAGFDWSIHQGDPLPGDSDMTFTGLMPPSVAALRDRFDLVEGLSGWKYDDVLRGDGVTVPAGGVVDPADPEAEAPEAGVEPGVNPGEQVLTRAGIARIDGLADVLPTGTTEFSAGNIILGGGGDDVIEGRGEDDVIDGDRWLSVSLRVPDLSTAAAGDTRLVDGLAQLSDDVSAGRLDPGDISIVRRVLTAPAAGSAHDSAVYSDPKANYDCSINGGPFQIGGCPVNLPAGASVTIRHTAGTQADGTDTLTGIEHLVFSDTTPPGVPTAVTASPHNSSATVKWTPGRGTVTDWWIKVLDAAGQPVGTERHAGPGATDLRVSGLVNGQSYTFEVRAENAAGSSDWSLPSNPVRPAATEPAAPTVGEPVAGNERVTVHWNAPVDDGGSAVTAYQVEVVNSAGQRVALRTAPASETELSVTGLTNGRRYWFRVFAVNAIGTSAASAESTTTPGTLPGPARIGTANGVDSGAVVRWLAPLSSGGLGISDYRIRVVDAAGDPVGRLRGANAAATRVRVGGLVNGETYRFQVAAVNEMGVGSFSRLSNPVTPGTRPDAPVIRRPSAGDPGGRVTATAQWSPPATATVPAITSYRVIALRMASEAGSARVLRQFRSPVLNPGRRSLAFELPDGLYRFQVVAFNALGRSGRSAESRTVSAR